MGNIEHLIELQRTDSRLIQISKELPELEREAGDDKNLQESTKSLELLKDEKKNTEQLLEDSHYRLTAKRSQLKTLRGKESNKMTGHQREMYNEDVRAFEYEIATLEDSVRDASEKIHKLTAQIVNQTKVVEDLAKDVERKKKNIHEKIVNICHEKEALESRRGELVRGMPVADVDLYDLLFEKKDGIAVTTAVSGVCQGCMIELMPWLSVKVARGEEMVQCPQCSRILYAPAGTTPPAEPKEAPHAG